MTGSNLEVSALYTLWSFPDFLIPGGCISGSLHCAVCAVNCKWLRDILAWGKFHGSKLWFSNNKLHRDSNKSWTNSAPKHHLCIMEALEMLRLSSDCILIPAHCKPRLPCDMLSSVSSIAYWVLVSWSALSQPDFWLSLDLYCVWQQSKS